MAESTAADNTSLDEHEALDKASQRQLWVLIGVVVVTAVGGVLRFVLFTEP